MNVLLIGSGGREHALGWKLAQSPRLTRLISLPGNPGLAELGQTLPGADPLDGAAVVDAARAHKIDLVVIGAEAPLAAGVTDALRAAGIPVWGPSQEAAQLESSKAFAKAVMDEAGVATAGWAAFDQLAPALEFLAQRPGPYVVKADGLAAGKGVLVTDNRLEAEHWVQRCLAGKFGEPRVVIEDYLKGPEVSVFALCDGTEAVILEPARDYKRLLNNDRGPNTGGMGSYSPVPGLPRRLSSNTLEKVIRPVLTVMADRGTPYSGFLYAGLVLTRAGPKVLEFNCRLGDPETQVVLPRLESDLLDVLEAGVEGRLGSVELKWSDRAMVNVVLAASGYPDAPRRGAELRIGDLSEDVMVFHAGTTRHRGQLVANGGRVLNVVGAGDTLAEARTLAYEALDQIEFPGAQFRTDIASSIG